MDENLTEAMRGVVLIMASFIFYVSIFSLSIGIFINEFIV
jgi:hypothetical protein